MKFNTNYQSHYHFRAEKNSGELITDTTGYVRPDLIIKSMINAGAKLANFRQDQSELQDGYYREENFFPYRSDELSLIDLNNRSQKRAKFAVKRLNKNRPNDAEKSPDKSLDKPKQDDVKSPQAPPF